MLDHITVKCAQPEVKGGECRFYTIMFKGRKVGVKVWTSESQARVQYSRQNMAHAGGCGPATYSKILPVYTEGGTYLGAGFITQLARVERRYPDHAMNKLDSRFDSVFGQPHNDAHESNMGYIGNKLVYIDFEPI